MGKKVQPQSTGNPLDLDDDEHCSVVMATETMKVRVEGRFRQRERKLLVLLIHSVWDEIGTKRTYSVDVSKIKEVFRHVAGVKNFNDWLWGYLLNLNETRFIYESTESNFASWMFGHVEIDKVGEKVSFSMPPEIERIIKNPSQFARLDTYFVIGLRGKYSVSLYQFLESKINMWRFDPVKTPDELERFIQVDIDELKQWLGVEKGQYDLWGNFNMRVLTPAIEEINSNPLASTFTVRTEFVRGARSKVKAVKFFLTKTAERLRIERGLKTTKQAKANAAEALIPPFTGTAIYEKAKAVAGGLDVYILEKEWRAYAREMNEPVKHPERAFLGFVKSWATVH